jgi:hypothetical protein
VALSFPVKICKREADVRRGRVQWELLAAGDGRLAHCVSGFDASQVPYTAFRFAVEMHICFS